MIEHFDVKKTLKLIQRKYFELDCAKQTITYVQTCDVCQRIKASRHKSYNELTFLFIFKKSWKKIIMNFVIDLSFNKRKEVVYDSILIIMNRYIKMIKYIFIIVKIDVVALTKMFFEEIVLHFNFFNDIISDKELVFISVFWSTICYHVKIKRRLSIVFHFQTNELIERQNQILKHYFWTFVDVEQTRWANLLSLTKFAINNAQNAFIEVSLYYACYDYHLEINYEIENNLIERKISIAKERVKTFHELKKSLMQQLEHVNVEQTRYYNKKHQSTFFNIENLMMFSIKNLKQKRSFKKLSHKYVESFKIKNEIETQIYRLTLSNIYRIHNIFHVFLLKSYRHRVDDKKTKQMMQISNLINDEKQ